MKLESFWLGAGAVTTFLSLSGPVFGPIAAVTQLEIFFFNIDVSRYFITSSKVDIYSALSSESFCFVKY